MGTTLHYLQLGLKLELQAERGLMDSSPKDSSSIAWEEYVSESLIACE